MLLNVLVDNHLIQLLFSADLLRFATGKGDRTQVFEEKFAFFELLAVTLVEAGVTFGTHFLVIGMFQDIGGGHQSTGKGIHTADMSQEDIIQIGRVTACLGIEVRTSGSQAACFEDNQPSLCQFVDVNRELVRIPTILIITAVRIDAAQHTGIGGSLKLMFECMSGQCGMVHFDIDGKIFVEAIMAQETLITVSVSTSY